MEYYKFNNLKSEEFNNLKWLQIDKEDDIYLNRTIDEYEKLKGYLEKPNKIIDLGCGLGRSSIFF